MARCDLIALDLDGTALLPDHTLAPETCRACIGAGANVLVAGSAVYKAADIPARIEELRRG